MCVCVYVEGAHHMWNTIHFISTSKFQCKQSQMDVFFSSSIFTLNLYALSTITPICWQDVWVCERQQDEDYLLKIYTGEGQERNASMFTLETAHKYTMAKRIVLENCEWIGNSHLAATKSTACYSSQTHAR